MGNMGFGMRWRQWMKNCISTPEISVLDNGSPTAQFGVERGLLQGEPLSPFLFNIVLEGLSCLFRKAVELGLLKGATFGKNMVQISHLQFADDTILFLKPNLEYLRNAKRILRCFKLATGLRINFFKSCLVKIGPNVPWNVGWAEAFHCRYDALPIMYLGLPLGAR
ncbi:hypothetical protein Dsin_032288 [Dipteronia sinensis]|uniref:Reverse transcriptase domain-containing protein n=1 Tax=Dipteronia sinensis TaxID=43782 RepID=A0AAD9ZN92_9ROSI|nr:hypothetical protein Dsin_032288 [Dipteronia sinensis]